MTKKQKKTLRRIVGSTVLFAGVWAVTALVSLQGISASFLRKTEPC